jgi:signal transduction histidine kinase
MGAADHALDDSAVHSRGFADHMGKRSLCLFSKRIPISYQSRIITMAVITVLCVVMAVSAVFVVRLWAADRMFLRRHQSVVAQVVAREAAQLAETADRQWAQHALAPLAQTPNVGAAYLFRSDGVLLAAYGAHGVIPHLDALDRPYVKVKAPIVRAGRPAGEVVILSETAGLADIAGKYAGASLTLCVVATALALVLAKRLARRVIEPVRRLSHAMDRVVESGDFAQYVEPIVDDELGRLTDAFNRLLRQLSLKDEALRNSLKELAGARDAAEAANTLKSQFLANMSHEIRTPLNGVLAMAQIMDLGELSPVQRERLDVVRESGVSLLAIVNDVLDLSKIEAGKLELEIDTFDPADLARHAEAAYSAVAAGKGLALVVDVQDSALGHRRGDATRLRQIVSNFLSNAIKFTEQGEVRLTLIGEAEDGREMLHLVVSDTGLGIPPEKAPLLFQKFSQVDSSTTRRFGGTGLGLAICRELAILMGGRVWVETALGKGSAFHLLAPLPIAEGAAPAPKAASPDASGPGARALRVLAAEDNATNKLVLRTIMQTFGIDLTLVSDGRQAVDAWAGGAFDLILMDIQMPVMDGVTATRTIRQAEAAAGRPRTPIVALSADAMTHQVNDYLAAGMDMHVAKPIELSKLHAAMRAVTQGKDAAASSPNAEAAA